MQKKILAAFLCAAMLMGLLGGCHTEPERQEVKPMNAISFDETGNRVTDRAAGVQYDVNYVFANALYKEPQPAPRVPGVKGNALSFDGYSTWLEAQGNQEDTSALTVSLWVAPRAFATRCEGKLTGLVGNMGPTGGFRLGMYNYGTWCFEVVTNKGSYKLWSEEELIDLYQWNYLTAVFDGKAGEMRLYKNGKQVASCRVSADTVRGTDNKLLIGKGLEPVTVEEVFDTTCFSGLMDELEIYRTALSAEEIEKNFADSIANISINVYEHLWLRYDVLADDRYAPQYHLRVSQNWQNETYGFFYYNGYYHAFCQQNPQGPYYTDGQRWGHFISRDLISWQELTPALVPEENGIDNNHVFSGTAVVTPSGTPKLFYTGVNYGSAYLNLIATATAADPNDPLLESWNKTGNVVADQGSLSTPDNFRDPFIYEENGVYYMLVGGTNGETGGGAIYCYRSTDPELEKWEYLSMLYSGDSRKYSFLGNCYEMPNLFRLTNKAGTVSKYLLMFSPIGDINGVFYLLGDFDAKTGIFIPEQEEPQRYDVGPKSQTLCPSGFYDPNTGRNLLVTMTRTGLDAQERYDSGWATVMTLVKEMYLSDDGKLQIRPIEEYEKLNRQCLLEQEGADLTFVQANALLKNVRGDMLRIEVEIVPNQDSLVGIWVKKDDVSGERVDISYDISKSWLQIDTSRSSTDMRNNGAGGGNVQWNGESLKLTVFVDRAMVEAYLDAANQVTAYGYNASADATGLELHSSGNTAVVKSIYVYALGSSTGSDVPAYWE